MALAFSYLFTPEAGGELLLDTQQMFEKLTVEK